MLLLEDVPTELCTLKNLSDLFPKFRRRQSATFRFFLDQLVLDRPRSEMWQVIRNLQKLLRADDFISKSRYDRKLRTTS